MYSRANPVIHQIHIRWVVCLLYCLIVDFLLTFGNYAHAQFPVYQDCSELTKAPIVQGPITNEEKVRSLDLDYSIELSRFSACVQSDGANGAGAGSVSGATVSSSSPQSKAKGDVGQLSESAASGDASKPNRDPSYGTIELLSSNLQASGKKSIAINRNGAQMIGSTSMKSQPTVSTVGKMHDTLEKTNNLAIIKEQIKAQADNEEDPEVKRKLMEIKTPFN